MKEQPKNLKSNLEIISKLEAIKQELIKIKSEIE